MAASLTDAEEMAREAEASPRCVTALGYNYLCNPAVTHAAQLIAEGTICRVVHVRGQFDEDYAADAALPWSWRYRRAEAGLGVLADLMCHLVGIVQMLAGPIIGVTGQTGIVHPSRPLPEGAGQGAVDNEDTAAALVQFSGNATGVLAASRAAWGRKNHLAWEVHGTAGMLAFDQERVNELLLYEATGSVARRGFRVIQSGPLHPPYARFCPAPGHQLGFNDLKTIEAHQLLRAIAGAESGAISFADGLAVERVVHAIAASAEAGRRITLAA